MTVELHSRDKSRGGTQIPLYSPEAPLPNPASAILRSPAFPECTKRYTKVEGREEGGVSTNLIYFMNTIIVSLLIFSPTIICS